MAGTERGLVGMAFGFILVLAVGGAAHATNPAAGMAILEDNCARCHAIGPEGRSPHGDAPPFRDIIRRYPPESLAEALAEGIVTGHPDMPVFEFTPVQIDNLIAYLRTLTSDPAAGLAVLEDNCAKCHALGPEGRSPHGDAPPFREIVRRYPPESLEEALAEGIVTGHTDMPEFVFTPEQIDNLVAYLETLQ